MIWAVAALAFGGARTGVASEACALPAHSLLYHTEVRIDGGTPVEVRVPVPTATEILVVASEHGADVRLERNVEPGGGLAIADTPARRLGPLRMLFDTGSHETVTFRIAGKERRDSRGTVRLQMVPLASIASSDCNAAYRLLAAGDGHYALGQVALDAAFAARHIDPRAEYRAAVETYTKAAAVLTARHAEPLIGQAELFAAATDYQGLQQWDAAARSAASAHADFLAAHDAYGAARARAMQAAADLERSPDRQPKAHDAPSELAALRLSGISQTFLELARFHARRREPFDEALALNNAGLADDYDGRFDRAIARYEQALRIYTRLAETTREAQVSQNIALVESELGRFSVAKRRFAHALALTGSDPPSVMRGEMLNNEGLADFYSGDLDAALQHYGEALELLTRLRSTRQQARSLQGLGAVYYAAGDRAVARDYFSRALAIRSVALDARGRIASLRALANVSSDLHQPAQALALRREALALAVVPSTQVRLEAQMASDLQAMGEAKEAQAILDRAVRQGVGSNRAGEAIALLARAQLNFDAGRDAEAAADDDRALNLLRGAELPMYEVTGLELAARIARKHDEPARARDLIDRALSLAEEVRVESANPELRAGLWSSFRPAFDLKLDLLDGERSRDHDRSAGRAGARETESAVIFDMLITAERSRARSLADYQTLHAAATDSESSAAQQVRTLYSEIAGRRFELETRLDRFGDADSRVRLMRADIEALQRQIDSLHRTAVGSDLREATPASVRSELSSAIEMIPRDTAVIEYWLGTAQARAWVVTRGGVHLIALGPSAQVERAARALHAGLRTDSSLPEEQRAQLISSLSALLIGPLMSELQPYRFLVIVPDGALHYVPFAVLTTGQGTALRSLVADHVLVTAPSLASASWQIRASRRAVRILVVSDPVYSTSGLERLPATALEAQSIRRLAGHSAVDTLTGFDASRASFLALDLARYRIIHVAAHGVTDTEAPQLSAVVLSLRDAHGTAEAGEVFAGDFLSRRLNAELVVLSACDTALGRELAGEGLLGLRYAVHAAGARWVIASLWQVPDRAAAELMAAFYTDYLQRGRSPPEALAAAMREMEHKFTDATLWGAFEVSAIGSDAMFAGHQQSNSKDVQ